MRSEEEIIDRIRLAVIEEIQATNILAANEPENYIPHFIDSLSKKIGEITMDEIMMRRRF